MLNVAPTEIALSGDASLAERLLPGANVMSCATVIPEFVREIERRCAAMECPVSTRLLLQRQARGGLCGGREDQPVNLAIGNALSRPATDPGTNCDDPLDHLFGQAVAVDRI